LVYTRYRLHAGWGVKPIDGSRYGFADLEDSL
jgi:hypothetical protein